MFPVSAVKNIKSVCPVEKLSEPPGPVISPPAATTPCCACAWKSPAQASKRKKKRCAICGMFCFIKVSVMMGKRSNFCRQPLMSVWSAISHNQHPIKTCRCYLRNTNVLNDFLICKHRDELIHFTMHK